MPGAHLKNGKVRWIICGQEGWLWKCVSRQLQSMLASAGGKKNLIRFDAYVAGAHVTSGSMASNSEEGNPITFALSSTGRKTERAFTKACAKARVTGTDAACDNTPCDDRVENLLKHTFNMKLVGPDDVKMTLGGIGGLPSIGMEFRGIRGTFCFEFGQCKNSGLIDPRKPIPTLAPSPGNSSGSLLPVNSTDVFWNALIMKNRPISPPCLGASVKWRSRCPPFDRIMLKD
jgi:hypothetical protein